MARQMARQMVRQMAERYIIELKWRIIYISISILNTSIIAYIYLPNLLKLSPIAFLNHKWEDALIIFIIISILIGFIITFPLIIFHILNFITPALYSHEYILIKYKFILWSTLIFIYWCLGPILIFYLPTFYLIYHSDTLILAPLIQDLYDIIFDYFNSAILLSILPILGHLNRKILLLSIILISTIFSNGYLILIPFILIIELWIFIKG